MNEFVETMKEKRRMCLTYDKCEDGCPLYELGSGDDPEEWCVQIMEMDPERAYEIIKKWAEENPEESMLEKFFKMFPNAPRKEDGKTPKRVCPYDLGWEYDCMLELLGRNAKCERKDCADCWARPYIEQERWG